MKVPVRWLTDFVSVGDDLDALTHLLSMAGLEVDDVHETKPLGPGFFVAQVDAVEPHPNADRLRLVTVNDGQGGRRVVCGAPNVEVGIKVVLAVPGATLPGGHTLGKAKIRGIESLGMLCSEVEIGRGADHSGILHLTTDAAPGTAFDDAYPPAGPVIEIGLTPNRPDCLSIRGVAREIGALTGAAVIEPDVSLSPLPGAPRASDLAAVEVLAGDRCPTYVGRVLEGVEIGPSPQWMVDRLASCGLRAINNVVDATNYVMLELGQPLHAFDLDRLEGHRIVVRMAAEGERLMTLDGVDRALSQDDLMICDAARPVAIAGVMGGEESGVTEGTTRLLLESACFEPLGVRRSAKRHQMHTDSSHRFERGVDPFGQKEAVDRLAQLILQTGGGTLAEGVLQGGPGSQPRAPIAVRPSAVSSLLGVEADEATVTRCLEALGIGVKQVEGGALLADPPSARVDLRDEADMAEEVARVLGYDALPTTLPWARVQTTTTPPRWRQVRAIEDYLGAQGLNQAVTYSFISPQWLDRLELAEDDSRRGMVGLIKPLSEELSVMRPVVVSSLLTVAAYNVNRQNPDVSLFEIGRTFNRGADGAPVESDTLCVLLLGRRYGRTWDRPSDAEVDAFDLKGLIEGLTATLGVAPVEVRAEGVEPWLRSGHGARLVRGGQGVGVFGEISPAVARAFGLDARVYVAELDLAAYLGEAAPIRKIEALPKHGKVQRDLAILVDRSVAVATLLDAMAALKEPLVEEIGLFDVYEGKQVPAGKRSVGFSVSYRAADRTLTEGEVSETHARILGHLSTRFGAELRA